MTLQHYLTSIFWFLAADTLWPLGSDEFNSLPLTREWGESLEWEAAILDTLNDSILTF